VVNASAVGVDKVSVGNCVDIKEGVGLIVGTEVSAEVTSTSWPPASWTCWQLANASRSNPQTIAKLCAFFIENLEFIQRQSKG
jgi:hypothetical protein